jgi:flagellar motor switch protein FliG
MSKRAAEMLQEDMDYMGPVRVKDVEESQQKVVNVVRALEEAGEIIVASGGEDELVV